MCHAVRCCMAQICPLEVRPGSHRGLVRAAWRLTELVHAMQPMRPKGPHAASVQRQDMPDTALLAGGSRDTRTTRPKGPACRLHPPGGQMQLPCSLNAACLQGRSRKPAQRTGPACRRQPPRGQPPSTAGAPARPSAAAPARPAAGLPHARAARSQAPGSAPHGAPHPELHVQVRPRVLSRVLVQGIQCSTAAPDVVEAPACWQSAGSPLRWRP